jgi:hypothetical protein
MPVVGLHRRVPKPSTQLVERREIVLNLLERSRPPASRQVLQQLGRPGVRLALAVPDNAGDDVVVQKEVIGAGLQLDQVVGHSGFLSDASWSSIHS